MDQIKITLPEVSETAVELRNINQELDEVLNYVTRQMEELAAVWYSEAAEVIKERYQRFASTFVLEADTVESYARFLDDTVNAYESLETTISANASNFN